MSESTMPKATRRDSSHGLWAMIGGTVVMSLGLAPVCTIANEMVITAARPERAGAASALSETVSEFSGALGIAVFGSIGTAVYRSVLSSTMAAGVPPDAAAAALSTLGAADSAARSVAGTTGDLLLASARSAFVDALQLTALIGAVIVLAASALARRILRNSAESIDGSNSAETTR